MQKLKRQPFSRQVESMLQQLERIVGKLLLRLDPSPGWMKTLVWISILALALSLCSVTACTPQMVRPQLPAQADPRPVPLFEGRTHRDVIYYVIELRETLQNCEADKQSIRSLFGDGSP